MLRNLALALGRSATLRRLVVSTPGLRAVAWRAVAGADLPAGIAAATRLNARGIRASLNALGEHVTTRDGAVRAADEAIAALRAIADGGLDANVSVKLTALGLDVDEVLCVEQLGRVLEVATTLGNFVRIDMESSRYVESTLRIFRGRPSSLWGRPSRGRDPVVSAHAPL